MNWWIVLCFVQFAAILYLAWRVEEAAFCDCCCHAEREERLIEQEPK